MAYAHLVDPATSPLASAIRATRQAQDARRPSGLHLSTICDDYHKALYPAKYRGLSEAASVGYQEIGNTFEDLLGAIFARKFRTWYKPKSKRVEGIWGQPDGANPRTRTIGETKAAWASAHEFLRTDDGGEIVHRSPKFQRYEMQILGYLYMWGWTRAQLDVWFVNGDWRPPMPQWPKTYILRYSKRETRENWRKLRQHACDRGWLKQPMYSVWPRPDR
jgi:hypothetical protein